MEILHYTLPYIATTLLEEHKKGRQKRSILKRAAVVAEKKAQMRLCVYMQCHLALAHKSVVYIIFYVPLDLQRTLYEWCSYSNQVYTCFYLRHA